MHGSKTHKIPTCAKCLVFRDYAAYVQRRTEAYGVATDLVPLGVSMTPTDVLDAAARRGLLYVIVITPQHETHRSVTLTILHGRNPQGKSQKGKVVGW